MEKIRKKIMVFINILAFKKYAKRSIHDQKRSLKRINGQIDSDGIGKIKGIAHLVVVCDGHFI